MTSAEPGSTVVVVTWRGAAHITACLDALAAQTRPHRTLVIDNASDDGTAAKIRAHRSKPQVIRLKTNTGYAGAMAEALKHTETPLTAWLNDDAAPEPTWLAELEDTLDAQPLAAAVTSRLELPDGTVQSTGVRLTADGHGQDLTEDTDEVFGFCGGAALLRTEALKAVGGVPASFFCYYEDTDTAWRLRLAGWHVAAAPKARVHHLHGASTDPGSVRFHQWNERNRLLMLIRCAPAAVAGKEILRFAVITALLPLRKTRPTAANFRTSLRLRVLAEVAAKLPTTLRNRRSTAKIAVLDRGAIWDAWAGL
ncbi:glycosyltransferase family 2 protein [Amycolatopsis rhabdoformis]|uniref:Glycosyltransferase family 2 protein n=1 Tax=Amycolatopsis rhabdoformis TaxID=1448059 RepID=A0ABZ1I4T7_9PSEU|nr:glycosyltransferase family 2 protein [Amycolatopsis rhabdoformis]WSE29431.1 glycosyltransferase family 2 protein [Amycolatopsis rhabdoformis]